MHSYKHLMPAIWLSALVCSVPCHRTCAADIPTKPAGKTESSAKEDFGFDIYDGKTNKIARVAIANPRFVWVVYEDGKSGRKIPRSELPPQLRSRYPYDSKAAEAYVQDSAQEAAAQRAIQKQGLQIRERELQKQKEARQKDWGDLQRRIKNLDRQIDTTPRHAKGLRIEKRKLIEEQDQVRKREAAADDALKKIRQQIDSL